MADKLPRYIYLQDGHIGIVMVEMPLWRTAGHAAANGGHTAMVDAPFNVPCIPIIRWYQWWNSTYMWKASHSAPPAKPHSPQQQQHAPYRSTVDSPSCQSHSHLYGNTPDSHFDVSLDELECLLWTAVVMLVQVVLEYTTQSMLPYYNVESSV